MLKFFDPGRLLAMEDADTATKVSPDVTVEGVQRGDMGTGVFGLSSVLFVFRLALGWILVSSILIVWYLEQESKVKHDAYKVS